MPTMKSKKVLLALYLSLLVLLFSIFYVVVRQPIAGVSTLDASSIDWNSRAADPVVLRKGELEFQMRCSKCHGFSGVGGHKAPSLNDAPSIYPSTYENIYDIVQNGTPGGGMYGWKTKLNNDDLIAITIYVKSLIPSESVKEPIQN